MNLTSPPDPPEQRVIGLYGDINEENTQEAVAALLHFHHHREPVETEEGIIVSLPVEFYVSTGGRNGCRNVCSL